MDRLPVSVILLSLLSLVLLVSTSFFAYQNMQLYRQIQKTPSPNQVVPTSSITPTCRPRPACLDSTPRCMMPETADMCPPKSQKNKDTIFCGGIAGKDCPFGYTCKLDGSYPDAGGTCVMSKSYTCPANGWVDCMPGPDAKPECSTEAIKWYKANCPNFQGAAL
jgi:hypothetical protein